VVEWVEIGNARLALGDCRDILPTLGRVSHVFADPPFEKEAHTAMRRTQASIKSGEKDELDFDAIDEATRSFVAQWAANNCDGWALWFCQIEAVSAWRDATEAAGAKYKRACIWVKPDSSPQFNGQGPAQGYESIVASWNGAGHSVWNAGGKRGVYTHLVNNRERHGVHKTEKPRRLMTELIADFSKPGDTILDCFMGSGTTGVSAVMADRKFIGIEMNPLYFDIACKRIEDAQRQGDFFVESAA